MALLRESFYPESVQGVTRDVNNAWGYWVDAKKGIAHVRIVALGKYTAVELERVMERLERDGLHGLILDLRWCPGGYLDQAVDDVLFGDVADRTAVNEHDDLAQDVVGEQLGDRVGRCAREAEDHLVAHRRSHLRVTRLEREAVRIQGGC